MGVDGRGMPDAYYRQMAILGFLKHYQAGESVEELDEEDVGILDTIIAELTEELDGWE